LDCNTRTRPSPKDGTDAKAITHLFTPRHVLAGSKSRVFGRREARRKSTFLSANVSGIRHSASQTGVFEETSRKTTALAAAGFTNGRLSGALKHFQHFSKKIFLFFGK
jgi:hypothetical protein